MASVVAAADSRRKREAMDALVAEIMSRGEVDNVSVSIRSALERGWNFNFADSLVEAHRRKEKEIDGICFRHYGDFLYSVQELLLLRGSAEELTKQIQEIHNEFGTTGQDLLKVLNSLEALQKEREETEQVLTTMLRCKEIASLMVETREQISNEDFYGALSTIHILQKEQVNITIRPIQAALQRFLPNQIDHLLNAVKEDLQGMFTVLRTHRMATGGAFLHKFISISSTPSQRRMMKKKNTMGNVAAVNIVKDVKTYISLQYLEENMHALRLPYWICSEDIQDIIPAVCTEPLTPSDETHLSELSHHMAPLLKALHVYAELDMLPSFHALYRNIREPVMTSNNMVPSCHLNQLSRERGLDVVITDVSKWMAGYFSWECISRRLVDHIEGVFSWSELTELWDRGCTEVLDLCTRDEDRDRDLHDTLSPDVILRTKETLLVLAGTMEDEACGLRPHILHNAMCVLWTPFVQAQSIHIQKTIKDILRTSQFIPVAVSVSMHDDIDSKLQSDISAFNLDRIVLDKDDAKDAGSKTLDSLEQSLNLQLGAEDDADDLRVTGHRTVGSHGKGVRASGHFPFSEAVVRLTRELHMFVLRFCVFAVQNPRLGDKGAALQTTVMNALGCIAAEYNKHLRGDSTTVTTTFENICQICSDVLVLSVVSSNIMTMVSESVTAFHWTLPVQPSSTVGKQAPSPLDKVAFAAQDSIFEQLNSEIESRMSTLRLIKWDAADVLPRGAHTQIEAVVTYMKTALSTLSFLPVAVREAAHFTCCSLVCRSIVDFLINKVNKVNMLVIFHLNLDVKCLETFADSCAVPQLGLCFLELRELVHALLIPDLSTLVDSPLQKQSLFPTLDPFKLGCVLEKIVNAPVTLSASIPKYEKKVQTALVKKLKQSSRSR
eukprot:gene4974-9946_t